MNNRELLMTEISKIDGDKIHTTYKYINGEAVIDDITKEPVTNIIEGYLYNIIGLENNTSLRILLENKAKECGITKKNFALLESAAKKTKDKMGTSFQVEVEKLKKEPLLKEAERILKEGHPLEYILSVAKKFHIGDESFLTGLVYSIACQSVLNSKGIQIKASGDSGKGKSSGCKTIGHLLPKSQYRETTLTPKALYYMNERGDIHSGMTFLCDDVEVSDEFASTVKRATTNFQTTTTHITVIKGEAIDLSIPEHINWWFTSVNDNQGIQMMNRQFQFDVDTSPGQDDAVYEHLVELEIKARPEFYVDDSVIICREIFRIIHEQQLFVDNGIVADYDWIHRKNRLSFSQFCNFMKAHALLHYQQRKRKEGKIVSEKADYNAAIKLYSSRANSQRLKLNATEIRVMTAIAQVGEISTSNLQTVANISQSYLFQLMNGTNKNSESGLLFKVEGLHDIDRLEIDGLGRRFRQKYYVFENGESFLHEYENIEITKPKNKSVK